MILPIFIKKEKKNQNIRNLSKQILNHIVSLQTKRRGCDWMQRLTTFLVFIHQLEGVNS